MPFVVKAEELDNNSDLEENENIEENIEEILSNKLCNDSNGNKYNCLVPEVDKDKKIYDYADLLTSEEEEKIYKIVDNYIESSKMDLVIVTINENPYGISDYYTQIYAQDFYYYNDFGIGNTKDGLIILIDMANRYPYIATKGNAILMYDDERIKSIHENAHNYLSSGNYYSAIEAYVNKIDSYIESGIPDSNQYYCIDDNGNYYKCKSEPKNVNWGISILVATLGSLIPAFIHTRKYKGVHLATNANSYLTNEDVNVRNDQFLTTFTSRVRRSHDSGSGGGHSHGGSTISHGSGGSFGGGGGRHF